MEASVGKDVKNAVEALKTKADVDDVRKAHALMKNEATENRLNTTTEAVNNIAKKFGKDHGKDSFDVNN
jgi:DNA polymerase III delta subunit